MWVCEYIEKEKKIIIVSFVRCLMSVSALHALYHRIWIANRNENENRLKENKKRKWNWAKVLWRRWRWPSPPCLYTLVARARDRNFFYFFFSKWMEWNAIRRTFGVQRLRNFICEIATKLTTVAHFILLLNIFYFICVMFWPTTKSDSVSN